MKRFAQLFRQLDQTTKTKSKLAALVSYFQEAEDKDKMWVIALFSHRRPKRTVKTVMLRSWAAQLAEIPDWLFAESYDIVGDLAETIALIIPQSDHISSNRSLSETVDMIVHLKTNSEEEKRQKIVRAWTDMTVDERFLFNKLITGGFRVGVSQRMIAKALAMTLGMEENAVAHRMMGDWSPQTTSFTQLFLSDNILDDISKPYPFYLTYGLEGEVSNLGKPQEWFAERKWDGIRGQLIYRQNRIFIWSRGEELVTHKYPELQLLEHFLQEEVVIDGEILPYKDGTPLPFNALQKRIGRKSVSKKILEEVPVIFMGYDLMEVNGKDLRDQPIEYRRQSLESIVASMNHPSLQISPLLDFSTWENLMEIRQTSRAHKSEGIMLKHKQSIYKSGRKKGDWWKWKIDPLVIDAVMIYAQRGHGRRASLYTDFTFGVWKGAQLIPFAKAYSGLTDEEFREVNRFIRANTLERYGPVRVVKPELVFEIAFEGINESKRHKSGVALRFPRMKRWRKDKPKEEANTLEDLLQFLES